MTSFVDKRDTVSDAIGLELRSVTAASIAKDEAAVILQAAASLYSGNHAISFSKAVAEAERAYDALVSRRAELACRVRPEQLDTP